MKSHTKRKFKMGKGGSCVCGWGGGGAGGCIIRQSAPGNYFHIKPSGKEDMSGGEKRGADTEAGGKSGEYGSLEANKRQCLRKMTHSLLHILSSGI